MFARFAYPPNELGYCGPSGVEQQALAAHAETFDGAWPYLTAIAAAIGDPPLAEDVVRTYWVGGPVLDAVDPVDLHHRLRDAFASQATGLLDAVPAGRAIAHHSFHVFVVYPWVRFLARDPTIPLRVLQACRIRWGAVEAVDGDHVTMVSRPLVFAEGALQLGDPVVEHVRWRRDATALAAVPVPGDTVAAHWDWVCGPLAEAQERHLVAATTQTLDLVNDLMR